MSVRIHLIYYGTERKLCTGVCTGGWIFQGGYSCSVQRNYINIMYWCMYRKMYMPGKIQLLGITELYEYYVQFHVQEDGYAREDKSARYNGTR